MSHLSQKLLFLPEHFSFLKRIALEFRTLNWKIAAVRTVWKVLSAVVGFENFDTVLSCQLFLWNKITKVFFLLSKLEISFPELLPSFLLF